MTKTNITVGLFVVVAFGLLATGLFLIGNQHKAFRHHIELYTEFANIQGISAGARVTVNGMNAGQVEKIDIPSHPSQKFRIKMQIDERLHQLIRNDSVVTIATEGLVGDKFLLIQAGGDNSPIAGAKSTLASKEPLEISKLLDQASGILGQANSTIADVHGKLNVALEAVTKTVDNTNGVVTDIRHGHGAAGVLLEDPVTAGNVKQVVQNTQQATANLNTASTQVNDLLTDFKSRQLFARTQQAIDTANHATQQLDQVSQQLNTTLTTAVAEDQYGNNAGTNLQQSLTNLNHASGNLTDDTAALKQEFFFRGFFKRRGYDDLDHIPATPYREGKLFAKLASHRQWLAADAVFTHDPAGKEILSPDGRAEIDGAVAQLSNIYSNPIILEGYSDAAGSSDQLVQSRHRAALVQTYLQIRFHIEPKQIGIVALSSTAPAASGKSTWNGVCLVELTSSK